MAVWDKFLIKTVSNSGVTAIKTFEMCRLVMFAVYDSTYLKTCEIWPCLCEKDAL